MIWLLLLWPIIGWVRLYKAYQHECTRRGVHRRKVKVDMDYGAFIYAAIWPFF